MTAAGEGRSRAGSGDASIPCPVLLPGCGFAALRSVAAHPPRASIVCKWLSELYPAAVFVMW